MILNEVMIKMMIIMMLMIRRVRRQIPRDIKQGCTTTGYEKRIRELCEEVLETVCKVSATSMLFLVNLENNFNFLKLYTSVI